MATDLALKDCGEMHGGEVPSMAVNLKNFMQSAKAIFITFLISSKEC